MQSQDGFPLVIAHRGIRSEIPENTVVSIAEAISLPGIHGVEFDVELADLPLVLHQETMVPSPDFRQIVSATRDFTSRDWVGMHRAEEITQLDAGSWFHNKFADVRVPLLKDVLALDWGNKTAFMELKDPTFWATKDSGRPVKMVNAVLSELLNFSQSSKVEVLSFNPEILKELRRRAPHIPVGLLLWTEWAGRESEAVSLAQEVGAEMIGVPDLLALGSANWVGASHGRGLRLFVYPVSPARGEPEYAQWTAESQLDKWKRLALLGVDAIISDFPRETSEFIQQG